MTWKPYNSHPGVQSGRTDRDLPDSGDKWRLIGSINVTLYFKAVVWQQKLRKNGNRDKASGI